MESDDQMEELPGIRSQREEDKQTLFARSEEPFIKEINVVLNEIDALVGLVNVKKEIHDMVNLLIVQKLRTKKGFKTTNISRHMVFMGNPGTGKTTIARKMAGIFKYLGVLEEGHLVEVDRSILVSAEMGKTAENMRKMAEEAMGGVLFIDEAYALNSEIEGDYGQEAIDTLLKVMEDKRDELVVIVAGYNDLMNKFLDSNPGLRSRFSKFIQFVDYTEVELFEIFKLYCKEQDYLLAEGTEEIIHNKIRSMKEINMEHFANARAIRNYFERVISNQANRMINEYDINGGEEALITITAADVEKIIGISREFNITELTNAIAYGNAAKAFKIAYFFGESPKQYPLPKTLGFLFFFFSKIEQIHAYCLESSRPSLQDAATRAGLYYRTAASYIAAAQRYPLKKTMRIISQLKECDYKSKSNSRGSATEGELLVELLGKIF